MRNGGFNTRSTVVDSFDNNTMDMSIYIDQRAFYDSYISETPPDISTDESLSPRSHASSMFDIPDLTQASSDMFYEHMYLDGRHISSTNSMLPPDFDIDENFQVYVARMEYPWTFRNTNPLSLVSHRKMISTPMELPSSTLPLRHVTLIVSPLLHLTMGKIFPIISIIPWMKSLMGLHHHLQPRPLAYAKVVTTNSTGVGRRRMVRTTVHIATAILLQKL